MVNKADRIDGSTTFPVILGDPIAQVRSPAAFNAGLRAQGCNRRMIPSHVPVDAFEQFLPGLMAARPLDGIVITDPFKHASWRLPPLFYPMRRTSAPLRRCDAKPIGAASDRALVQGGVTSTFRRGVCQPQFGPSKHEIRGTP